MNPILALLFAIVTLPVGRSAAGEILVPAPHLRLASYMSSALRLDLALRMDPANALADTTNPAWNDLGWVAMDQALRTGAEQSKKVLVYVHAPWCPYCRRMNNDVLSDPEVQAAVVRYFSPVRINTESDETIRYFEEQLSEREFAQAIGNQSLPTLYFMSAEGKVFANQPGALPKEIVLKLIHFVGSDAYLTTDFESYSMPD